MGLMCRRYHFFEINDQPWYANPPFTPLYDHTKLTLSTQVSPIPP